MAEKTPLFVALGSRLKGVPEVLTLGVKPNFLDYSMEYGREGLRMKGMDLKQILREKILSGELMPCSGRQSVVAASGQAVSVA